ncbi:MAG: peptidase [Magnetococcales bacterium]|nr:peptidase [Magnetococcales bacterium]
MNTILHPIPIFKVGRHTDMSGTTLAITEADLEKTVAAYQPSRHEAPLVVGHPQHDAPAWGWVASLALVDGTLLATPHQVDPAFAEQVAAGRYKKISASFYTPNSPSNPHPGVYYLRHVGFLGAQPPAVKGLPDALFREGEGGVVVWECTTDWSEPAATDPNLLPTLNTLEPIMSSPSETPESATAEAVLEQWQRKTAELNAREAQFAEREERLHAAEMELKRQQTRTTTLHFVETLIQEGRILPRHREGLVSFIAALDETGVVEFAEPAAGNEAQPVLVKTSPVSYIHGFLKELPPLVDFQERVTEEQTAAHTASFCLPEGYTADAAGLAMYRKVHEYAKKNNMDFARALLESNK